MNPTCLLIGAKSDIGRAIAHRFALGGWNVQLAGRDAALIEKDAADIRIRYKVEATAHELDVLQWEQHEAFYRSLSPAPDLVICVAGYMPQQAESEKNVALAAQVIGTNFTGCAILLNVAANEMEARKSGGIIGISSVAGERGRATNYFYGSAKAGFTAFLSGLRNRLAAAGVHVLTVKPGFVYTRMTQGLKLSPRLTATPERVAEDVWKAWLKKKNVLWTKGMWRPLMWVIRSIPEWKFKKMKL